MGTKRVDSPSSAGLADVGSLETREGRRAYILVALAQKETFGVGLCFYFGQNKRAREDWGHKYSCQDYTLNYFCVKCGLYVNVCIVHVDCMYILYTKMASALYNNDCFLMFSRQLLLPSRRPRKTLQ